MRTLLDTRGFARKVHEGQVDKQGRPYHEHALAVASLLPDGSDEIMLHAAMLHDVLEDTDVTKEDLHNLGYSSHVIDIIDTVTRKSEETYVEFISRIAASRSSKAIKVKIADLTHNTDESRGPMSESLRVRYERAKVVLREALSALDAEDG